MKNTIVWQLLMLLLPVAALAQADPPLLEDFSKKTQDIQSFALNKDVNIVRANLASKVTEISAVDSKMQVLWRTKIDGYGLTAGSLKGKIFVIVATEHSFSLTANNIYDGFLLDPATGNVLLKKTVYNGMTDDVEVPTFFSGKDGSFLRLVTRQTNVKRKLHVGLPGPLAVFTMLKINNDFKLTKGVKIIEYDQNLDVTSTVIPQLNSGFLFGIESNSKGNVFLSWSKGRGYVEAEKFEPGKNVRSAAVGVTFNFKNEKPSNDPEYYIKVMASESDPDVLYYAVAYDNAAKDMMLSLAKVNFKEKLPTIVIEKFDKTAIKLMEKAYIVINDKLDKPDLGNADNLKVGYLGQHNGNVIVSMHDFHATTSLSSTGATSGSDQYYMAPIISGYDLNLKIKVRQILPTYLVSNPNFETYYFAGNRLYFIGNMSKGRNNISAFYGVLDLSTGQNIKQQLLSKKHIKNIAVMADAVMWYGDSFIVPYEERSGMIQFVPNKDYTLQLNNY